MGPPRKEETSQKFKRLKEFFRPGGKRQQPQTPRQSQDGKNPLTPERTLTFSSFLEDVKEENERRLQAVTDLYQAINRNDDHSAIKLYQKHASLNPRDKRGRTPLHTAAELGRDTILRLLLDQKGVNLDATDIQGFTALHLAAIHDHLDCVSYLLERGANAQLVDGNGHLPSFYASPDTRNKFDNPPIVHGGNQYAAANHWKDNTAYDMGPTPGGAREEVCRYFQGSLWVPDISTRWRVLPVWELVYEADRYEDLCMRFNIPEKRTVGKKKWIHLPIASRELVLDLAKRIYAASGRDLKSYQKVEKLVNDMFKQVDVTGPEGKVHFKVCMPLMRLSKGSYVQTSNVTKFKSLKHGDPTDPEDERPTSESIYAMAVSCISFIS